MGPLTPSPLEAELLNQGPRSPPGALVCPLSVSACGSVGVRGAGARGPGSDGGLRGRHRPRQRARLRLRLRGRDRGRRVRLGPGRSRGHRIGPAGRRHRSGYGPWSRPGTRRGCRGGRDRIVRRRAHEKNPITSEGIHSRNLSFRQVPVTDRDKRLRPPGEDPGVRASVEFLTDGRAAAYGRSAARTPPWTNRGRCPRASAGTACWTWTRASPGSPRPGVPAPMSWARVRWRRRGRAAGGRS